MIQKEIDETLIRKINDVRLCSYRIAVFWGFHPAAIHLVFYFLCEVLCRKLNWRLWRPRKALLVSLHIRPWWSFIHLHLFADAEEPRGCSAAPCSLGVTCWITVLPNDAPTTRTQRNPGGAFHSVARCFQRHSQRKRKESSMNSCIRF